MSDDYTLPKQDTWVETLNELDVAREELRRKGFITDAEYNHLYCMLRDVRDLMSIAMRGTIHLQAECFRKEERGERENARRD